MDELLDLGVSPGRMARRDELIVELWARKRLLMRQLYEFDDPTPPCA